MNIIYSLRMAKIISFKFPYFVRLIDLLISSSSDFWEILCSSQMLTLKYIRILRNVCFARNLVMRNDQSSPQSQSLRFGQFMSTAASDYSNNATVRLFQS